MQSKCATKKVRSTSPLSKGWARRVGLQSERLALLCYTGVGSDICRVAEALLKKKQYKDLVNLAVNPSGYSCPQTFRDDYFAACLFSKYPHFDTGIDKAAVALEKFESAEISCGEANQRLMFVVKDDTFGVTSTEAILYRARGKINRLLRSFSWDRCSQYFGFGPGGTHSTPKRRGDSYYKFGDNKPTTTEANLALAYAAIATCPSWFRQLTGFTGRVTPDVIRELAWYARDFFTVVEGNKVITVPKNAKTDRTIAKEPLMNSYVQKGIGELIRRKLRHVGVDLNDQTLNQRMAKIGSEDGSLATMDLKAASDSVSMELCRLLLPSDWMSAIELCRSPCGVLPDGRLITYEKVSSMGNGFTFELESLIFWAICSACIEAQGGSDHRLAIYGDDLIFPVDCWFLIKKVLAAVGFETNDDKSYWTGKFRESCGKHYFGGVDVTPVYIRQDVDSVAAATLYSNELRCWAVRPDVWGLDSRLLDSWSYLTQKLPHWVKRCRMPYQQWSLKDGIKTLSWATSGALIGDFDEVRPPRAPNGHEGFLGYLISKQTKVLKRSDVPIFLKALSTCGRPDGQPTTVNTGVEKVHRVSVVYPQWPSMGPWL